MSIDQLIHNSYLFDILKKFLNKYDIFALNCALNPNYGEDFYNFMLLRTVLKPLPQLSSYPSISNSFTNNIITSNSNFTNSIAIGSSATTSHTSSIAIGSSTTASQMGSIAIGQSTSANNSGIAIGNKTISPSKVIIVGYKSSVKSNKDSSFYEIYDNIKYKWLLDKHIVITGHKTMVDINQHGRACNVTIIGNNNNIFVDNNVGIYNINIIGNNLTIFFKTNKVHKSISIIDNDTTITL
jgi:autotransporter adhesin